jgi:FG-GAP-like repeat
MRRLAGVVLAAAAVAAASLSTGTVAAPPAGAQTIYLEDLVGNFVGDDREEIFTYISGDITDTMMQFSRLGPEPGSDVAFDVTTFTVNGRYDPVAGDFDGDGFDEILWYAPGTRQDFLWNFTSTTTVSSTPYTANGYYQPFAGDLTGDGADDVVWYAPGTRQDYVWDYNPGGGYNSAARTINGTYVPVPGSFGTNNTDDVLWYAPGPAGDYLWDYAPNGSYVSKAYPANGYYEAFTLDAFGEGWRGSDIFWYAPGTAADYFWDYVNGVKTSWPEPANWDYYPVPGDVFGDGQDDIVWFGPSEIVSWDFPAVAPATASAQADGPRSETDAHVASVAPSQIPIPTP